MPAETFYAAVRRSGVSRRDFLRFCATTTAFLGLEGTALPQVVKALETQKRPPIYWLNFAACSCCSESLIKSSHLTPEVAAAIAPVVEQIKAHVKTWSQFNGTDECFTAAQ